MFEGLRTVIYAAPDIARAKGWYSQVLDIAPYFDQPFYVGFNVGGYELGLDPNAGPVVAASPGVVAYWGVSDIDSAYGNLLEHGAREHRPVRDVGGGIRVGSVLDPFGNIVGIIDNPHFKLSP